MTKQVQLRRGSSAEHQSFTGAVGEVTIDTDLDVAIVHDGSTVGGHALVGAKSAQEITNKLSVGIGTTVASSELTVVGNVLVSSPGIITTRGGLDVSTRPAVTKSGTVVGFVTDKITGISTSEIFLGDFLTISSGSLSLGSTFSATVTEIGTNTLTVSENFDTGIFTSRTGYYSFEQTFSNNIEGLDPIGIQVGYAITGDSIPLGLGLTVTQVGVSSIFLSGNAENGYFGQKYDASVNTTSGSNVVTGVNTSNLRVGSTVQGITEPALFDVNPTTVLSIGVNQITVADNAASTQTGTDVYFIFTETFYFAPGPQSISPTIDNPTSGVANIDKLNVDNAFLTDAVIDVGRFGEIEGKSGIVSITDNVNILGLTTSNSINVNPHTPLITDAQVTPVLPNIITGIDTSNISRGDTVKPTVGAGVTVGHIQEFTVSVASTVVGAAGGSYSSVVAIGTEGSQGSGATFDVSRDISGNASVTLVTGGSGYILNEELTLTGDLVGGVDPTDNIILIVDDIIQTWLIGPTGVGASITDIGIGTIFLDGNVNTGTLRVANGSYVGVAATSITGIDTTGFQVGYGVTNELITGFSTITEILNGQIFINPPATNEFSEYTAANGNVSTGSTVISGIDTTGIQVGAQVIYSSFPDPTVVVSVDVGQVTVDNTSDSTAGPVSITFLFQRLFYVASTVGVTSSFTVTNGYDGRAYIDIIDGDTSSYNSSYISTAYVNSGIVTEAGITSARIDNLYIDSGISTSLGITSSRIDNLFADVGISTVLGVTSFFYADAGITTEAGIGTATVEQLYANSGIITNVAIGTATVDELYAVSGIITTVGINSVFASLGFINSGIITEAGINTANVTNLNFDVGIGTNIGVGTVGVGSLFADVGVVTTLYATDAIISGVSTFGNVTFGSYPDLIVSGDSRITGILTVGANSITIGGATTSISGVTSVTATVGVFTDVQVAGINTATNLSNNVTFKVSKAGIATDYTFTLPPTLGTPGQLLSVQTDGTLGFTTNGAGLFEARYYVSAQNGNDSFDGKALPVRTIKRAAQLASFESFVIPGQRYLDAGDLLEANKTFMVTQAIGALEFNYEDLTTDFPDYDEPTWREKLDLFVDNLIYDIRFGGNSKSVETALDVWAGAGGTSVYAGEEEPAIYAYNYLKFLGQYVINNQTPPTLYEAGISTTTQTFDFTVVQDPENNNTNYFHRSKDARNLIVGNRQELIDKSLASVAIGASASFYFPGDDINSERNRFYDAYKLIQINRDEIINYAWNATAAVYPGISATETKCKRDLGYFLDAVSTDVFTGGNSYARAFVGFYFDANGNPTGNGLQGEETESIYAFEQAAVGMSSAVTNQLTNTDTSITADPATGSNTDPASCANVRSNITTLVGIVTTVIGAGSTTGIGTTSNYGYFVVDADANVGDTNWSGIGITNVVGGRKCARDLGYIADAIAEDISYGTNQHIVYATKLYFDGTGVARTDGLVGEESISGYAFTSLGYYAKKAVTNQLNYQDLSIVVDAGIGTNIGDQVCSNTQTNIDTLVGILTTAVLTGSLAGIPTTNLGITDCADVRTALSNYVGIVTAVIGLGTSFAPTVVTPSTRSRPVCVFVEAGDYTEDNPIILYDDVAVVGDNLRNTIIRAQNQGQDLFRVRNGVYLTGFAMKDSVDSAGVPQNTFNFAVAFDDPNDPTVSRLGYATKSDPPTITRSPYIQNCSILSFLGGNGILVDGNKVQTPNVPVVREEAEQDADLQTPEQGKSMVAAAFTMVSFGGIGWRTINDGYAQVVSCFQIFCRYGSLTQSGGYLSITNSATNFGLYALRSTGFSRNSFVFDRGRIAATGTSGGLQTLKAVGYGRSDLDNYILQFFDNDLVNRTSNFKAAATIREINAPGDVDTVNDIITYTAHGFVNSDSVVYNGDEQIIPNRIIGGLVNDNQYYVQYVDDNNFKLFEDEGLETLVDLTSASTGIHTFTKATQDFFVSEILNSGTHNSYQRLTLAGIGSTAVFVSGREVTQTIVGGTAVGYALTYNTDTRELIVGLELSGGERKNFAVTNGSTILNISDHSASPVSIGVTVVAGLSTYWTVEFKLDSTISGNLVQSIGTLPEDYRLHFHRPSIINSSSHTWEYSGSGIDYNALPQNGGQTDPNSEQVRELGGRVYSSGTNELGDFKIGDSITAFNRTGNIIFNNTVTIGELDSLRLSLSGGVAVEEFSTDVGLGDNELGGPLNKRVSTQLAVRSFLSNRLGSFIDKSVSTNAIPNAVVQLNSTGQINADLIPPKTVNYYRAQNDGGRTQLVNLIPATNLQAGDTVVEPSDAFVLISDLVSEYIILDNDTVYDWDNGDIIVSTTSAGAAIGTVSAPPGVGVNTDTVDPAIGYGVTGLVRGVPLTLTNLVGGSGYSSAGIYTGVRLDPTSGIGTGISATITVGASGTITNVAINTGGRYFAVGDSLALVDSTQVGGRSGGSSFTVDIGSVETRLYLTLTNNQKFPGTTIVPDYIADGNATAYNIPVGVAYTESFNPTDYLTGGDVDFANDRIIVGSGHTFVDGDPVIYSNGGGATLSTLVNNLTYYVKVVGAGTSVELYTTYGLSTKKDLDASGTGTHTLTRLGINTTTSQIVFESHGFTIGDPFRATGDIPTGITTNGFYFVGSVTTNSFTLHETQAQALASNSGLLLNAINLGSAVGATGTLTLTEQNVQYTSTVNTSSSDSANFSLLSTNSLDAANIISGTVSPSRLGSGTANSDTFLRGDSSYQRVISSVGIGTTQPLGVTASYTEFAPGGVGINTYYGDIEVTMNRVQSTTEAYSTLGISKFKLSTFGIGSDGAISIKGSSTGDIDAATLGGLNSAYYLDITNSTGSLPISRGGTGLAAAPSTGFIMLGNGTTYTLTGSPELAGVISAGYKVLANKDIEFVTGTWTGEKAAKIQYHSNNLYNQFTSNWIARNASGSNVLTVSNGGNATFNGTIQGTRIISTQTTGTAPFTVSSTTKVTNLNADLLDDLNSSSFMRTDANTSTSGSLTLSVDTTDSLHFTSNSSNDNRGIAFNSRTAISADYNDGYLRLNNAAEFSNGIYTPGTLRVDGAFHIDGSSRGLTDVTSDYGTIQTTGSGVNGWEGYNIDGRYVFMSSDSNQCGIYNDVDNEWMIYCERNARTILYHNGSNKLETASGGVGINGSLTASGNITAYSSDRRLKENLQHIESPLEKVLKLNGYTFDWNELSKKQGFAPQHETNDIGLIAQEVEAVLPQATAPAPFDLREDGTSLSGENYLTVQYERLVPLLVEAIKEQNSVINNLKTDIEYLKSKLSE